MASKAARNIVRYVVASRKVPQTVGNLWFYTNQIQTKFGERTHYYVDQAGVRILDNSNPETLANVMIRNFPDAAAMCQS